MHLRIFTEPQQGASYEQLLRVAQHAEAAGFDAFFRSDHFLAMGGVDGLPGPTDAWVTLGALARETKRIRLGTLVSSATFRYPGVLAITVAQVDAMSGGRVELGLGAGWFEAEHRAYAVPFPELGARFDRLEEQLAILTGLWTTPNGRRFSFDGRQYQISESPALPKPVQSPHPPIIIGGGGPKRTPELAARYAAEFNMAFPSPERAAEQFQRVDDACRRLGRDPKTMLRSVALIACCGRTDAEVSRRAAAVHREVNELKMNGLAGSPAEIVDKLGRYAELGVERVYLQILDLDDLDHLDLIASAVLPRLRGIGVAASS